MFRPIWLRQLRRRRYPAPTAPHRPIFRPCLEVLEQRTLLSGDISTIAFQQPTPNPATVNQSVTLTANVMDITGRPITAGVVDFEQVNPDHSDTILVGGIPIPNGTATTQYAFTNPGSYNLFAHYEGSQSAGWAASDSSERAETVQASQQTGTQTTVTPVTLSFSSGQPQVNLSATVDDVNGKPVGEGSVNFMLEETVNNQLVPVPGAVIEPPNPAPVSDGSASAVLILPPGLAVGKYTIAAGYSDGKNGAFASSSSTATDNLTINPAATTVGAVKVTPSQVTFSEGQTPVQVSTTITSGGKPVSEGNVTFTVAALGISTGLIHVNPDGTVQTTLSLPAGAEVGAYTVQAAYSDDTPGNFGPSSSPSGPANLTVNPVVPSGGNSGNSSATVGQLLDDITKLEAILSGKDTNAINTQLAVVSNDIGQLQTSAATESAADRVQTDSALFGAGVRMILDGASAFLTNLGEPAAFSVAQEGFAAVEPALVDLVLTELSMIVLALQPR